MISFQDFLSTINCELKDFYKDKLFNIPNEVLLDEKKLKNIMKFGILQQQSLKKYEHKLLQKELKSNKNIAAELLGICCQYGNNDYLKAILESDIIEKNKLIEGFFKSLYYNNYETAKIFIELLNFDIDFQEGKFLQFFCKNGNIEAVKFAIYKGADITLKNNKAIKNAAEEKHIEIVKLLIECGSKFNFKSIRDNVPEVYYLYELSKKIKIQRKFKKIKI